MPEQQKESLWSPQFIGFSTSSCFFYMAQYILISALPLIITNSFGGTAFNAGMAMMYFQLGTVICRPFAGELIDGVNKRVVLLVTTVLFLIVMIGFDFIHSLQMVYILRLLHGAIFAVGTTAVAAVAVLVLPKTRKGEGIGYFSVAVNIAMVIGPFLGLTVFQRWGTSATFMFLSIVALLAVIAANFKPLSKEMAAVPHRPKRPWNFDRIFERKTIPWSVMGLFACFTYSGVLVFVPILMTSLGIGTMASWFFIAFALVIVVTRPWVGRAYDNLGPDYLIYPGYVVYIIGLVALAFSTSALWIIVSGAVIGLGYGAIAPAFQTLGVQAAKPERAGAATATYFWSLDIGVGLGSLLLSLAIESLGFTGMYLLNAGVALVALVLYHFVIRPRYGIKAA